MKKEILMMVIAGCPHCARAQEMVSRLCEEHSEYQSINIKIVDETMECDFAASLDYYYVPSFFVDGIKIHEGCPTLEAIENVFKTALGRS